jgi:hypothetical protein
MSKASEYRDAVAKKPWVKFDYANTFATVNETGGLRITQTGSGRIIEMNLPGDVSLTLANFIKNTFGEPISVQDET